MPHLRLIFHLPRKLGFLSLKRPQKTPRPGLKVLGRRVPLVATHPVPTGTWRARAPPAAAQRGQTGGGGGGAKGGLPPPTHMCLAYPRYHPATSPPLLSSPRPVRAGPSGSRPVQRAPKSHRAAAARSFPARPLVASPPPTRTHRRRHGRPAAAR